MYNSVTEDRIKDIPKIGDVDVERLPQELTKIHAQIVGIRRQYSEGKLHFPQHSFIESLEILQTLANNLETILMTQSQLMNKEAVAFVAGTAHSLIHKIRTSEGYQTDRVLEIDSISPVISAIVLFLIGNSQADAAEMASFLPSSEMLSAPQRKLIKYVKGIAKGQLQEIIDDFPDDVVTPREDLKLVALDYLWRELSIGIYTIAANLSGSETSTPKNSFDTVTKLAIADDLILNQKFVFNGPYHLAKLMKILEENILKRAVVSLSAPIGIDSDTWADFLRRLAKERPYLWENHMDAVSTNFLTPGTSAVLTLPTGAGKSTLSELKIASCLFSGHNVVYLVPTHALEAQIEKNLKLLFEGIKIENSEFGGEYTEFGNPDSSPILVMTPERCLSQLNINPKFFQNVGLVVFDEFHLIHGTNISKDRRSIDAMYCVVSLFNLIPQADYLMISAMVQNGEMIQGWISQTTQRECILFNSSWKPTRQLLGCLIFDESEIRSLEMIIKQTRTEISNKTAPKKLLEKMTVSPKTIFSLKNIWETEDERDYYASEILDKKVHLAINGYWKLTTNRNKVAAELAKHFASLGLKTLVFVSTPAVALSTSKEISSEIENRKKNYIEFIGRNESAMKSLELELGDIKHSYLNENGNVGVHHGLLFPLERNLIELFFKEKTGSLVMIATATLAQGINLPAEVVIIAGDDRFDEETSRPERIEPHELLNAAGRAGRAGQSSQGVVIVIPGKIATIRESTISDSWWKLKREVFSKSDQCLAIEDPLEHFLDSIQDESQPLNVDQINVLYRFKSEDLSDTQTKTFFKRSFYAYKATLSGKEETFHNHVERLIKARSALNNTSEDILWSNEISFKTGIDPQIILKLGNAIDEESDELLAFSVKQLIDWFIDWLNEEYDHIVKIFTKSSTINQIKATIGLKSDNNDPKELMEKLPILRKVLKAYVSGVNLAEINEMISPGGIEKDPFLNKARSFSIRLVPELSFAFGLFSMILIEKEKGRTKQKTISVPWTIKALASCIRDGVDDVEKLFYKKEHRISSRVEIHALFRDSQTE